MTIYYNLRLALVLTVLTVCFFVTVNAQNKEVNVGGDVAKPFTINATTFAQLQRRFTS